MPCDITYIWSLKYETLIYKIDSQTQRTGLWLPSEDGRARDRWGV